MHELNSKTTLLCCNHATLHIKIIMIDSELHVNYSEWFDRKAIIICVHNFCHDFYHNII